VSAQAPDRPQGEPISSLDQLLAPFTSRGTPRAKWRVGLEHEKIGLLNDTLEPIPFDGPRGIETLFQSLIHQHHWTPVYEKDRIVSLHRGSANITLEPGGQLELSGAPYASLLDSQAEIETHLREVVAASEALKVSWLTLAFHPFAPRAEIPWMPKGRYRIMREYMPKRGQRGIDMMLKTTTVQANLDYQDEADAADKLRVATAISPIITALFANSPFENGTVTGWRSTRMSIWLDTDPDRSGVQSFLFDPDLSYRRYVEWALDVPMYLIYRNGQPLDMTAQTFRQFWQEGYQGERALPDDWALHLTTLFPEVRLKSGYVEVRGGDMGSVAHQVALGAVWKGILYSAESRAAAFDLVKDLSITERRALGEDAARHALSAKVRGRSLADLARELVALAPAGLPEEERGLLDYARDFAERGESPADALLRRWEGEWKRDPRQLVAANRF
jgi:glutamate--cysteine ligase